MQFPLAILLAVAMAMTADAGYAGRKPERGIHKVKVSTCSNKQVRAEINKSGAQPQSQAVDTSSGYWVFCPPGQQCPPPGQQPGWQSPPQFDFADDAPVDETPKLDIKTPDTTANDVSLATLAAVLAGAAGLFVGYKNQKTDPSLVQEAVEAENETIPALEVK